MSMTVGDHTYGQYHIKLYWEDTGQQLIIGKFCSIAEGVKVFLGGEHPLRWATTYPFGEAGLGAFQVAPPEGIRPLKGGVTVGNDVWLGNGATIMSGVTIADGAVIAANSHVVKDVGPYEVWGGNPAKLIRQRFSQEIIDEFMKMKWWDLPNEIILELIPYLQQEPTMDIIGKMWAIVDTDITN